MTRSVPISLTLVDICCWFDMWAKPYVHFMSVPIGTRGLLHIATDLSKYMSGQPPGQPISSVSIGLTTGITSLDITLSANCITLPHSLDIAIWPGLHTLSGIKCGTKDHLGTAWLMGTIPERLVHESTPSSPKWIRLTPNLDQLDRAPMSLWC